MQFRLLGPLEISSNGTALPLTSRHERLLLARLLVTPNQAVPLAHLMDVLWDADPPATAKRQLQNCCSSLRSRLTAAQVPAVIVAHDSGYRLRVDDGQIDVIRFQTLCKQARGLSAGDGSEAIQVWRLALALWRGPALAGLTGTALEACAARLDEQRMAAYEECFDLQLQAGHCDQALDDLYELVPLHPTRERLVGQLMLALYLSGRKAESLATFHRLRGRLADELGINPSERLQRLHTAILRDDVDIAGGIPPSTVEVAPWLGEPRPPSQLPMTTAHFVGRSDALGMLERLLAAGCRQAPVIAALTGGGGVGKTALAMHWAHRVADQFPDGQLFINMRGFDPSSRAVMPSEAIPVLLDGLGVQADRIPAGLDAQVGRYRSELAGKRLLIVLDDVRDTAQVRPLLPGTPTVMVVLTSRNQLTELVARDGAHPLCLQPLSSGEAQELIARKLGTHRTCTEPAAVNAIIAACARLPLALVIATARVQQTGFSLSAVAAELRERSQRLDTLDAGDRLSGIRSVFSWSYQALPSPAARLLRLLALDPGADISTGAAASLSGLPQAQTRRHLTDLVRANLLTEHAPNRYTIHDLLRDYVTDLVHEQEPESARRDATARLLLHYTLTAYTAERLLNPLRDPCELAPDPPPTDVTVETIASAAQATHWLGTEYANLLAAQRHAAGAGWDLYAWQIAWAMDTYLVRCGHRHALAESWQIALAAGDRLESPAAQAYAHLAMAIAYLEVQRHGKAREHAEHALGLYSEIGHNLGQGYTHRRLAYLCWRQGDAREALRHAECSLALFRAAGHQCGIASGLNGVGWYHAELGDYAAALQHCQQALGMLRQIGDLVSASYTLDSLGYIHHHLGQHAQAIAYYRQAVALQRQLGDRHDQADTLSRLGDTHHATGNAYAARAAWQEALLIYRELQLAEADDLAAKIDRSA